MGSVSDEKPGPEAPRWLDALDMISVAVFAISGVLAAEHARLDLLGVVVLAAVTAIGGGTTRDLLIGRPVFWMRDVRYLVVILLTAVVTIGLTAFFPVPTGSLLIADALGLAFVAIAGAQVAEAAGLPALVVIVMGTLTGSGGGAIRDVLSGQVPAVLRADLYATAAIAGIAVYLLLDKAGSARRIAIGAGVLTILALRYGAVAWGWHLPIFNLKTA
jgi:uncharacterized membrane protein YeiH